MPEKQFTDADLQKFFANKAAKAPAQPAATTAAPQAQTQAQAKQFTTDDLKNFFAKKNTQPPAKEGGIKTGTAKETTFAGLAKGAKESLFGKTPEAQTGPSITADNKGVMGRLWEDVSLLPTGTGKNIGELTQGLFNPLGRTDTQQQFIQERQQTDYKKMTEGSSMPTKIAASALEGVGENITGQVSAFNLALLFGGVAKGLGEAVEGAAAPSKLSETLGKLAHLGFTTQMATGAYDAANASVDAFRNGDYETGVKMAVSGLIAGAMARSGAQDTVAQQQVSGALDKQSQKLHGQKFADLKPEQQAQVVYEAAKQMPLHDEIKAAAADEFIERAKREGLQAAPVSDGLADRLAQKGVRPFTPTPSVTPEIFAAAKDHLAAMRTEATEANTKAAAEDLKAKANREMSAIPNPEKTKLPESPTVLQVPTYTPAERENIRYEADKAAAMHVIETERAAELARQAREEQLASDARARNDDNEQESAARSARMGTGYTANDRRPELHQQIMQELGEKAANSEPAKLYQDHVAALNRMTDGMGFRDTELAARMIRAKRERGETLNGEENSVLAMHAKREDLLRGLAKGNPRAESILAEHDKALDVETLKNVLNFTQREADLRGAARNLEEQATKSGTPEAADLLAQQAIDAQQMAEKVQTQREREQAAQTARKEEKQVVLRGPNLPYTLGKATEVHLADGRALGARYAAARLSQLVLSHDPFSFRWNDKYEPRRMQPRDWENNINARGAIIIDSKPENYKLGRYLTDNPTASEGPAMILPDGRVAGGNSRLARMVRRLAEGDGKAISAEMASQFHRFGIEMDGLEDENDPMVLVRVMDDVPETTQDLIMLGQELNRDPSIMGVTAEEQGQMNADRLTQEDVDGIANMMEEVPGEGSLRDVLRHRSQQVLDMMVKRGIIPANKQAAYISNGELTENAKRDLEAAIRGKVIDDPALVATTPASIMNSIDRTLPALLRLKSAGGTWEIGDYLKEAMRQWKQIDSVRASLNEIGGKDDALVDKFYNPENYAGGVGVMTFGEDEVRPKPHPVAYAITKALEAKATEYKRAFDDFAAPAEGKQTFLIAPPEPYEVFNDTIGKLGGVEVHPADWATMEPASPEQKAAVDKMLEPAPAPTKDEQKAAKAMTMPPNVAIAANNVMSAIQDGSVRPQQLRELFAANPSTAKHADLLMEVLGKIVPNATGMPLPEFLARHVADVQAGGEYSGGLAQEGVVGPVWTMKSQGLIDDKMKGPMPGDAVLKMLENNGVKRDELKWAGLGEFLKGKGRVTPAEVKAHLAENALQLKEVTKGGEKDAATGWDSVATAPEATKYHKYQMPGGENYREMLLTLPESDRFELDKQIAELQNERRGAIDRVVELRAKLEETFPPDWEGMDNPRPPTKEESSLRGQINLARQTIYRTEQKVAELRKRQVGGMFQSGHWDEPNILAHVRMNDRTTPDGKRLLHLEEIQSDWHQKGRDVGYEDPERQALNEKVRDLTKRINNAQGETEQQQLWEERRALQQGIKGQGVPDAPFKKDWHEMAFRRMVRLAAEKGYDGVSWTPGEKQAERYDLSKQISRVKYGKHADPDYPQQHSLVAYDHKGEAVHSGWYDKPEDFVNVIGKEPTHKLLEATPDRFGTREISGLDLKVGGEGMKGFYDKIIPDYARKFGKQWGAKVGETAIRATNVKPGHFAEEFLGKRPDVTAPYLEITPEMRREVTERGVPMFQKEGKKGSIKKGATQFLDDGRAIVQIFEHGDASTVLHEFTHVMRRFLVDENDRAALERFAGVQHGLWDEPAEERVARGFEKYMEEGMAPTEELQGLFAKMKQVFRDIYGLIKNGKYRLPKASPINIELSKEARATFDRWFGADAPREMTSPPDAVREMAPPPSSLSDVVSAGEREEAVLRGNGGNPIAERLGDSRLKRFHDMSDANAWVINNSKNLYGAEVYELPNGESFVNFVPKDSKTLFQEEPRTLAEMVKRSEYIKSLLAKETRPDVRERMQADIRRLDAKIGVPDLMLSATPESTIKPMTPPPDMRPELKPDKVELLFGGDRDTETERSRSRSDASAELQQPAGAGEVAERAERPAAGRATERNESRAGRGDERSSLSAVRATRLATPERMRAPATVPAEKWASRMKDLRMPETLPAPTVKVDNDLAALLIFPGQVEVVESTLSALDQFDGTIIATPTGTGKSYTTLAVVEQMRRKGQADRVLVLTKNDSIINAPRKGLKEIGKNTFKMEVADLPKKNLARMQDGVYATTYATLRGRPDIMHQAWDLVMMDESAEAANWQESAQGQAVRLLNNATVKTVYVSATPFASAVELGYMGKLGLWKKGEFADWAKQFGVVEGKDGKLTGGNDPKKLLKLREQMIERGQFVTQEKSMEGFSANFAQVPLTPEEHATMKGIIGAMKEAALFYDMRGNAQMAKAVRGNMATFVKSWLERTRLPQTIEIAKKMRDQGWKVVIFSETRAKVDKMYDFLADADAASEGRLSKAIPKLPGVYEELEKAFGTDQVANFSGAYSSAREGEKEAFDSGSKPILFATYGAGGVGVSLHDDRGNAPRAAIYLGPPWSGKMLDQAMGRAWRYGTKSNVFSVFMTSNAMPETRMILTKVAPRLESLRAAVDGVSNDPMVERMRNLGYNREELAKFEMGGGPKTEIDDMMQVDDRVLLSNYAEMVVPSAESAKHKGMKYPGQVEDRPGVIQLFQSDGTVVVPDRFATPEERKGQRLNEEIAQTLTDGGTVPGVGNRLSGVEPGIRRQMADLTGPQIASEIENGGEADASAVSRIGWGNELTKMLAAKEAGEITVNEKGQWQMQTPGGDLPDDLKAKDDGKPKVEAKEVNPAYWTLSGRENLVRIASQAGVPEVGVKLKRMRDEYQVRRANVAGDFQSRYLDVLKENKITPQESRVLFLVKEGKLPPPNERIAKAAEGLTKLTLDAHRMLADRGWKGNYFADGQAREFNFAEMSDDPRYAPHKHDRNEKIILKDPQTGEEQSFTLNDLLGKSLSEIKRQRIIETIEHNTGMAKAEIENWIDAKRRRTPLAGNLERARQADLPFYRMDANVWMEYFEQLGEAVARADVFGQTREKLDAVTVQIPSKKGRDVANQIFDGLLSKLPWDQQMGKWYSRWGTAQVLSKMTFSSVKVPFHLAHTAVVMEDMNSVARSIFNGAFHYSELKERAQLAGVLVDQMKAGAMMEQAAGAKAANAMLKYEGFHWMYQFDRITANAAAQNWMERYALPKMIKKARASDHIRTQLKEKFLMDDKSIDAAIERGRWSQEDLNRGGAALTNRTLFTTDPTELAPAWRSRSKEPVADNLGAVVRIATILKGFTFKTAMLIKEDIIGEARKGNYRPLMYAAMVYPAVGEALQAASATARSVPAALTGNFHHNALTKYADDLSDLFKDPSVAKLAHRWLDDVGHATALTVISEMFDTLVFPPKSKRSARFKVKQLAQDEASWAAGPYADLFKTADAAYHVLGALTVEDGEKRFSTAGKAISGWAKEEFPVLRTLIPDKKKNPATQMAPPPR